MAVKKKLLGVLFDVDLLDRVRKEARRQGYPVSILVRRAVVAHLRHTTTQEVY